MQRYAPYPPSCWLRWLDLAIARIKLDRASKSWWRQVMQLLLLGAPGSNRRLASTRSECDVGGSRSEPTISVSQEGQAIVSA